MGVTPAANYWEGISFPDLDFFCQKTRNRRVRILITGVSGMLGGYFSKAIELAMAKFSTDQVQLVLLTSDKSAAISNWQFGVAPAMMSYRQFMDTNNSGVFDFIFHFGSPSSNSNETSERQLADMNNQFLHYLVDHVAKDGFLLFLSSSEVYGNGQGTDLNVNKYGAIKSLGEKLLNRKLPVNSLSVRLFHTFGPGLRQDDRRGFASIIQGSRSGSKLMLTHPNAKRNFLSNFDFGRAINLIVKEKVFGHLDLAGHYRMSMMEFAKRLGANAVESENPQIEYSTVYPNLDKLKSFGWRETLEFEDNINQLRTWQNLRWNK